MIAVMGKLMDSWHSLLNGVISVPVYKEGSVPEEIESSYVELRAESASEDDTKHSFRSDEIVITDIVTMLNLAVDRSLCEAIDDQIKQLIRPTSQTHGLAAQSGMQILFVYPETTNYLEEYDSGKKYYRKIVRYRNRIVQTT